MNGLAGAADASPRTQQRPSLDGNAIAPDPGLVFAHNCGDSMDHALVHPSVARPAPPRYDGHFPSVPVPALKP
jgi:hypothetical protein